MRAAPSIFHSTLLPLPLPGTASPASAPLPWVPLCRTKLRSNHTWRRKKYSVQEPKTKPRKKAHRELWLFMTPIFTSTFSLRLSAYSHCMPSEKRSTGRNIWKQVGHSRPALLTRCNTMRFHLAFEIILFKRWVWTVVVPTQLSAHWVLSSLAIVLFDFVTWSSIRNTKKTGTLI